MNFGKHITQIFWCQSADAASGYFYLKTFDIIVLVTSVSNNDNLHVWGVEGHHSWENMTIIFSVTKRGTVHV